MGDWADDAWDFWEEADMLSLSYNSEIDENLIDVFKLICLKEFNSDIAEKLKLPRQYVEVLQGIFCDIGWCDYGTSPRGCWVDLNLDKDKLIKKLENWYSEKWK